MNQLTYLTEFSRIASLPDEQIALARCALLIASVEYPELALDHQLGLLDSLAAAAARSIAAEAEPLVVVNQLSE